MEVREPSASYLATARKQTEIGSIPVDWDVSQIGDLISDMRGGAPLKPSDFTDGGVKVLPKGAVGRTGWLQIREKDLQFCSLTYAARHIRNQVDPGYTIVVLRDLVPSGPSIGLIVRIQEDETFVLAQGVYGFRVTDRVVPGYLVHLSNTNWYRKLANSIMVGSTQVHITNTAFKKARIPLPPTQEQESISKALDEIEALIDSLEQLLTKKRQIKQGAMQELLTGKRRLPGFGEEWSSDVLRNLVETPITDGPHMTPVFVDSGVPFLSVNNLIDNQIDFTDLRYITREDDQIFARKCKPQRGDVLLGKAASVGKVAIVEDDVDFNIWSPIALIRPGVRVASKFLFYQLQSQCVLKQINVLTNASSQGNLGMGDIERLQIQLPCTEEQRRIANVLSDMDCEISSIEDRLTKARALKQAMAQALLTGRIRLVEPTA